jgi:uncharacterized protein
MRGMAAVLLAAWAFSIGGAVARAQLRGEDQWREKVTAWRAEREKKLAAPDGWLTLTGLEWLKSGVNSVGSAEGERVKLRTGAPEHLALLTVSGKSVQLLAPKDGFPADLKVDGQPAREGALSTDDNKPSTIAWKGMTFLVLERGGRYALRIKDADAPSRKNFHGLDWYPLDTHYIVAAKWTPYSPVKTEKIPTIIGTTLDLPAPGVAEFELNGKTLRLEPVLEDPNDKKLFFILRDETSKSATYQAARFLYTSLPENGLDKPGELILDFNQLQNPPCAYTAYATCPLPPEQNRLPVAIEAGEKRYAGRVQQ